MWSRSSPPIPRRSAEARCQTLDLTDESAIQDWAAQMYEIDWLVNSAGMLRTPVKGPEKTIRHVEPAFLKKWGVNALP